ncbi:hypothetical protein IMZ48_10580 [Candidatus Bathyarchaeota archaeon]|nr:hypothetical protein [Candidatus Bathyarchaeota archaeon]
MKEGFERFKRFRLARASHIKSYVGKYMAETQGVTGEEPINLVFLAIRSLVPNLVQKEGLNKTLTPVLAQRDYAEKLGLALNELQIKLRQARLLRACAVDMCFGLTVAKTSLAASGQMFTVAPDIQVDPGQIYTERISLDDMTADPCCTSWDRATFIGHRIRIERNKLIEADGFNRDLVRALPRAGTKADDRAQDLSKDDNANTAMTDLQDYVNIVELWVPEADAVCYIPDPEEMGASDFLKIEDYYGPPSGHYTFGALTQPVPDNPFPIAPVGVWRDLSDMANKLFKKAMNQADRQKNVMLYRPSSADVADAVKDAYDGETVVSEDPDGVKVVSFEGPSQETVGFTQTIYGWFNLVAGNPDLMSGASINADKATGQQILQQNASIGVGDMRDMMYDFAAEISGKQAWYLHNDDLLFVPGQPGIPLIKRLPDGQERQLFLTPQDKTGEFETLGFKIVRRSMTVIDPENRARLVNAFTAQTVPQAFQALMVAMQAGQPFNIQRYLTLIAEDMGISEVVDEIFTDPDFRTRMEWYASTHGKGNKKSSGGMDTGQNGQFPVGGTPMPSPQTAFNQQAQATAAVGQANMNIGGGQL